VSFVLYCAGVFGAWKFWIGDQSHANRDLRRRKSESSTSGGVLISKRRVFNSLWGTLIFSLIVIFVVWTGAWKGNEAHSLHNANEASRPWHAILVQITNPSDAICTSNRRAITSASSNSLPDKVIHASVNGDCTLYASPRFQHEHADGSPGILYGYRAAGDIGPECNFAVHDSSFGGSDIRYSEVNSDNRFFVDNVSYHPIPNIDRAYSQSRSVLKDDGSFRDLGRNAQQPRLFPYLNRLVMNRAGLFSDSTQGVKRSPNPKKPNDGEGNGREGSYNLRDSGPPIGFGSVVVIVSVIFFGGLSLGWYATFRLSGRWFHVAVILAGCIMALAFGLLFLWGIQCDRCHGDSPNCTEGNSSDKQSFHADIVPQKYFLTSTIYWGTVLGIEDMHMPNILAADKQVAVISALAEGAGIRQVERMTDVNRNTIMSLGLRVGKGCAALLDAKMRNLTCEHIQMDEMWGFIGKKERHIRPEDSPELGSVWTFCAIDTDTKLVPAFAVGKRDAETANRFVMDVASRMVNRVQVSTDALVQYAYAMELAFGGNVDFAQIVKVYDSASDDAKVIRVDKTERIGNPDMTAATTSHVERLNGTTRLHMRRLTRLTYGFSKKLENFEAAVGLHFAYYNFVKRHGSLRCTPAQAAGIEREQWTVKELVGTVA
jgi:IS1 family transposase